MTDLEITKLCAEAMGLETIEAFGYPHIKWDHWPSRDTSCEKTGIGLKAYDPLHDDAQAMGLVKKFRLDIGWSTSGAHVRSYPGGIYVNLHDLNRAICECVAKLESHRQGAK